MRFAIGAERAVQAGSLWVHEADRQSRLND